MVKIKQSKKSIKEQSRINPNFVALVAGIFIAVYCLLYVSFDTTIKLGLGGSLLYLLAFVPVFVGSLGLGYSLMAQNQVKDLTIFIVSFVLGSIIFLVLGLLFYFIDSTIIYARY